MWVFASYDTNASIVLHEFTRLQLQRAEAGAVWEKVDVGEEGEENEREIEEDSESDKDKEKEEEKEKDDEKEKEKVGGIRSVLELHLTIQCVKLITEGSGQPMDSDKSSRGGGQSV